MQGPLLVCLCLALAVALVSLLLVLQTWEHRRFVRSRIGNPRAAPCKGRVLLVVPCKGADADFEANLRPLFEQDREDYQLAFVVEGLADDACPTIQRLRSQYPRRAVKLVVAGLTTTHGQKVHNLLAATSDLDPQVRILAFADTDIRPPRDWLRLLTQRLDEYDAATGYRWFVPKRASFANCLLSSMNAALVPLMFPGRNHLVWGGSWAVRRDVFEDGNFRAAWHGTLSDDLVAAQVLARMKCSLSLEPACIVASPIDVKIGEVFAFVRRQLTIGRVYSRAVWMLFLLYSCAAQIAFWTTALAAVWGAGTRASWTWQPALATAVLYALHVVRGWLRQEAAACFMASRRDELAGARWFDIWLAPLTSLAACGGLLSSAVGRWIVWRNIEYEMQAGGQIRRILRHSEIAVSKPALVPEIKPIGQQIAA